MTDEQEEIEYRPIQKNKASDAIVEGIWRLITTGKLNPGDKLPPERDLKDRFNVSIVTLREALRTLESYGHITKKRGAEGGSFILDIAPTKGIDLLFSYLNMNNLKLEELHNARLMLDPMLAAYAAEHINSEEQEKLKVMIENHISDFKKRGTSRFGWELYIELAKISGNRIYMIIQELLIRLLLNIEFSNSISDLKSTPEQYDYNIETLNAHQRIVQAILDGDAEKARQEMTVHRLTWFHQLKELLGEEYS